MANEAYLQYGTQLLFADHSGDFGAAPTTANNSLIIGTPTDVQIDCTNLAASGGGRQSAKTADLGAARGTYFRVDACIEFASAPTDGANVSFYWAGSPNATPAVGNGGGVTGSDAAYADTSGTLGQLTMLGSLVCRANVICIGYVGAFAPEHRYGSLIVVNNTAQAFHATVMDEVHIVVTPIEVIPGT